MFSPKTNVNSKFRYYKNNIPAYKSFRIGIVSVLIKDDFFYRSVSNAHSMGGMLCLFLPLHTLHTIYTTYVLLVFNYIYTTRTDVVRTLEIFTSFSSKNNPVHNSPKHTIQVSIKQKSIVGKILQKWFDAFNNTITFRIFC